jgi:hypothetical protein
MKVRFLLPVLACALWACGAGDAAPASDLPPPGAGPAITPGVDYAAYFDGVDDYATSGTAGFPLMTTPQTVSLWARYASGTATQIMIVLRADLESGLAIGIADGTVEAWNIWGRHVLVAAPSLPAVGLWHHVAYIYDGTTHTLYIDGASVATGTRDPGHRTPFLSWLGTLDGTTQMYRGSLDEVRIWDIARSPGEIALDMNGQASAVDPGLVAYWSFNHVEGSRVIDDSGRGNHVSLGEGDVQRMPAMVPSDTPVAR